ncbi:alcohol oxidase [Leucogyrophana mollusca]|uniref:Alcohol oxidase n=1 Tax=Leucogyrophana mollusca TaxID=85980 RepID=A0ACB8BH83_9AGAM|nr:alcohol oxidase [Leucogyrophana mollusca]
MSFADLSQVAGKGFDFVIIGGGTSGLCVAARLSENPKVSVVVLEAGQANIADPLIITPGGFRRQLGDPAYDWMHKTVPQTTNGGFEYVINGGKGLGGSSRMSFLSWNKPAKEDMDVWEKLGNPGWNWNSFAEFSKRSERHVTKHRHTTLDEVPGHSPGLYGEHGPISVSVPAEIWEGNTYVLKTMEGLGVPILDNAVSGEVQGVWTSLSSIDPENQSRCYAVTGYLLPNVDRPNLTVLPGARVQELIMVTDQDLTSASGVRFAYNSSVYEVYATREVILCAGALSSPSLLELSGIGDRSILEPLGIDVKFHLPGVGRNMQEHITHAGVCFELKDDTNLRTYDLMRDPEYMAQQAQLYLQEQRGLMTLLPSALAFLSVQTFSTRAATIIEEQVETLKNISGTFTEALLEQYRFQLEGLRDSHVPECEIIIFPGFRSAGTAPAAGKRYFTLAPALLHPWSRGEVHVSSADPEAQLRIDPHYLEERLDLELMVDIIKYARSVGQSAPLSDIIAAESLPGPTVISDGDIRDFVKNGIKSTWHTTGTLSMLPSNQNGVVDHELRVYGTKNIRVADLSVAPMQISSHTQTIAYAIAERGKYVPCFLMPATDNRLAADIIQAAL